MRSKRIYYYIFCAQKQKVPKTMICIKLIKLWCALIIKALEEYFVCIWGKSCHQDNGGTRRSFHSRCNPFLFFPSFPHNFTDHCWISLNNNSPVLQWSICSFCTLLLTLDELKLNSLPRGWMLRSVCDPKKIDSDPLVILLHMWFWKMSAYA